MINIEESMIYIKDTSSIFQLAFGLNFVIILLLKITNQNKKEFIEHVISEIKKYNSFIAENKNIDKSILLCYPFYKIFKYLFFFILFISFFSISCSFYYLCKAVTEPELKMSTEIFELLSVVLVLINPILYTVYEWILNSSLSVIKSKLKISNEFAKFIATLNEVMNNFDEQTERLDKLNYEANKIIYSSKIRRFKNKLNSNPFLHPIKWFKDRRMRKYTDELLK